MRTRFVPDSFHARFSAKGKTYRYRIWNGEVLPPLENGRAWHIRDPLDCALMATAANSFLGRHNFHSFAANRGAPAADTIRTICRVRFQKSGSRLVIEFEGDGFLYKMVRMMVGTLAQIALGKASPREIQSRLRPAGEHLFHARSVAPAAGLFLIRVRY